MARADILRDMQELADKLHECGDSDAWSVTCGARGVLLAVMAVSIIYTDDAMEEVLRRARTIYITASECIGWGDAYDSQLPWLLEPITLPR